MQKEYKTRHDWMGKVIHKELCKKLKFDHTNKWYMHNSESVPENGRYKELWDFEIEADHLYSASRSCVSQQKTYRIVDFAIPGDHRVKLKESKKKGKYLVENWKNIKRESDGDTNCNWCARYSQQKIDKGTGGLGKKWAKETI